MAGWHGRDVPRHPDGPMLPYKASPRAPMASSSASLSVVRTSGRMNFRHGLCVETITSTHLAQEGLEIEDLTLPRPDVFRSRRL